MKESMSRSQQEEIQDTDMNAMLFESDLSVAIGTATTTTLDIRNTTIPDEVAGAS